MSVVSFLVFLVFTVVMRQSLTQQIGGYLTTFPDRYFMGLNVLVVFIVFVLAAGCTRQGLLGFGISSLFLVGIPGLFLINYGWLVELSDPRMKIAGSRSFQEELCVLAPQAADSFNGRVVNLPIYPRGWYMALPEAIVVKFFMSMDCSSNNIGFYITDGNWVRGISRSSAGFFVPSTRFYLDKFTVGRVVQFADMSKRKVTRVVVAGDYLNVFVEGSPLDPSKVGIPSSFTVSDQALIEKGL